jgi:hypothetical protein
VNANMRLPRPLILGLVALVVTTIAALPASVEATGPAAPAKWPPGDVVTSTVLDSTATARVASSNGDDAGVPLSVNILVNAAYPVRISGTEGGTHIASARSVTAQVLLGGGITSDQQWDSSIGIAARLTQYWWDYTNQGHRYVKATNYTTQWQRLDPSLAVHNAHLRVACLGGYDTGGFCYQQATDYLGVPSIGFYPNWGTLYQKQPSWSNKYVEVAAAVGFFQCGQTSIDISGHGYAWELWFNVCQGAPNLPWP